MRCEKRVESKREGFTLIESLLALVILSLMGSAIAGVYFTGLYSLDTGADRTLLDSAHRSRMEEILGRDFSAIVDGTDTISIRGISYGVAWTVTPMDLDGDTVAEPTVKMLTVSLASRDLTAIVVDNEGRLGKI